MIYESAVLYTRNLRDEYTTLYTRNLRDVYYIVHS